MDGDANGKFRLERVKVLNYFCINHGEVFKIYNHYKCLSWLFPIYLNTYVYVMGLRLLEIFQFFQYGDRFYTSESDFYRRQILTYKDGPRTVWGKQIDILMGGGPGTAVKAACLECR